MTSQRTTSRAVGVGLLVVAVAIVALLVGARDNGSGHELTATVDEATNLIEGLEVEAGGKVIGAIDGIDPVDGGRRARITLDIRDEDVWPLPRGSRFTVRWGGTAVADAA